MEARLAQPKQVPAEDQTQAGLRSLDDTTHRFFVCIRNEGYAVLHQVRTVYAGISDPEAKSHGMLRIVDESEDDYLFPARLFVPMEVPDAAVKVFAGAA